MIVLAAIIANVGCSSTHPEEADGNRALARPDWFVDSLRHLVDENGLLRLGEPMPRAAAERLLSEAAVRAIAPSVVRGVLIELVERRQTLEEIAGSPIRLDSLRVCGATYFAESILGFADGDSIGGTARQYMASRWMLPLCVGAAGPFLFAQFPATDWPWRFVAGVPFVDSLASALVSVSATRRGRPADPRIYRSWEAVLGDIVRTTDRRVADRPRAFQSLYSLPATDGSNLALGVFGRVVVDRPVMVVDRLTGSRFLADTIYVSLSLTDFAPNELLVAEPGQPTTIEILFPRGIDDFATYPAIRLSLPLRWPTRFRVVRAVP